MSPRRFYVYILASRFRTLYIGVTNDIERRLAEHRSRTPGTYTARYRIGSLVHLEEFGSPTEAIAREKSLKGWRRERKEALIEEDNPQWKDLSGLRPNGLSPRKG